MQFAKAPIFRENENLGGGNEFVEIICIRCLEVLFAFRADAEK